MTTLTAVAGGGNWGTAATWSPAQIPTAADDCVLANTSGNVTIDGTSGSPSLCRSLSCTGYTGTLTHGAAKHLTIGDASGGSLTIVSGMTYNPTGSSVINFVSTTTGNNIAGGGKTHGSWVFNGSGGAWTLTANVAFSTASSGIILTQGTFSDGGFNITSFNNFQASGTLTRALTMSGSWTAQNNPGATVWDITDPTNMTLTATGSTITATGSSNVSHFFNGGGLTYGTVTLTCQGDSSSPFTITGNNSFATLTTSTNSVSGKNGAGFALGGDQTVSGTYTANGNSSLNRCLIASSVRGTARTITVNTTVTVTNIDMRDITGAGTASWNISAVTGKSGDCGGNSGITFTTPVTAYYFHDTGNFSNSALWFLATNGGGGAARVPLPQDSAIFDGNSFSTTGKTVTFDMPRIGGVDFSAATNAPTMARTATPVAIHGSYKAYSGLLQSGSVTFSFDGRGSFTITMATTTLNSTTPMVVNCPGGTYTLQDALSSSSTLTVSGGTLAGNSQTTSFTTGTFSGGTCSGTGAMTFSSSVTVSGGALSPGSTVSCTSFTNSSGTYTAAGTTTLTGALSVSGGTMDATGQTITGGTTAAISGGTFNCGTLVLSSTYTQTAGGTTTIGSGGVSCTSVNISSSNARTINMGSGTWTLSTTGTVWDASTTTNLTLNANTSIIEITNATATGKTFAGGGATYSGIKLTGDNITISGSNTFSGTFNLNNAGLTNGLKITAGTTQTLTASSNCFINNGSAGNLTKLLSSSAGSAATLTAPNQSQISVDYMSIKDSTVTQSGVWYAGANSTNVSGNTRWNFTVPPAPANGGALFICGD